MYGPQAKPETGAKFCILRQRSEEERARVQPECMNHRQYFSQLEVNNNNKNARGFSELCTVGLRPRHNRGQVFAPRSAQLRNENHSSSVLACNNVFGFWPFIIFLTGALSSFASIMNRTPWRSEKLSARSLRIVYTIERKNTGLHERLRDFIVLTVLAVLYIL